MSNALERAPNGWQTIALVGCQRTCYAYVMSNDDRDISVADAPGSFAARLFHARSAIPLTQEALADMAGLQQSAIAHYEAGRREPSLANLRRLVWALGGDADYILATRRGVDEPYRQDGYADGARPAGAASAPLPDGPADVRGALIQHLATGLHAALISGDLEASRIAHGALGCLLAAPGGKTTVVDLATERARRGGIEPLLKPGMVLVGQPWRHKHPRRIGDAFKTEWEFVVVEVLGEDFANMAVRDCTAPVAGATTHEMLTSPEWVFLGST